MKKLVLALALAGSALFGLAAGSAQAAPLSAAPGAIGAAAESMSIVDTVQYVYSGRRHCWYASGWKGPGWYVCGNRWRRGYGWGGPAGWQGWSAPVVVAPSVVVRGPYFYSGRHWNNRRWHRGRWVYY